jgi:hypothetical protein
MIQFLLHSRASSFWNNRYRMIENRRIQDLLKIFYIGTVRIINNRMLTKEFITTIFLPIIYEFGYGDLPSLRSREGKGVSNFETKEPNKVSSAKPNSRSDRCVQRRSTAPQARGGGFF